MCGICGIIHFSATRRPAPAGQDAFQQDALYRRAAGMLKALAHRGPDGSGLSTDNSAVLGATRLAIRGLDDGAQPITDRASGVMVVCNGEIDNHHELRAWLAEQGRPVRQATDIAVIPGLYLELGEAFAERLVGAFAIAIWDPREQKLVLARDRAGERPLFYSTTDLTASFATEIASLTWAQPSAQRIDTQALGAYLQFGSFAAPAAPFANIHRVKPAEVVTLTAGGVHRRCYWQWNIGATAATGASLDAFDAVFREAVRRQSDIDVNYGVFLSGGVDSSLVAAVARSVRPERQPKAYTLRFAEASYDEGGFAMQVAEKLGLESVPVWVRAEDFPATLKDLITLTGEPLADPAWIPAALLARRAAQDASVALVGEGADELFGGYPTYLAAQWGERYARLPGLLKSGIRGALGCWPHSDKNMTIASLLKRFVQGQQGDGLARHLGWTSNVAPALLTRLGVTPPPLPVARTGSPVLLDIVQRNDLETTLAEGLLTKADRAGMSSALELRAPFLDQAVMEFAAGLPIRERIRGFTTKVFLKRYALRYLPESIVHRRKRGLSVPLKIWLREPLYEWAVSRLESDLLDEVGVKHQVALELLEEHRQQRGDHSRALWTLIVLSEWLIWAAGIQGEAEK